MRPSVGLPIAFESEAWCLLGRTPWRGSGERRFCTTALPCGVDLVAVRSGVGLESAFRSSQWLVGQGIHALLSIGLAGGLNPLLRPGELIIGDRILGPATGEGHKGWRSDSSCAEYAYSTLSSAGMRPRRGSVLSSQSGVLSAEEKRALYRSSRALAVDMESSAIARVATESDLPFFVLRAVIDFPERTVDPALAACLDPGGEIHFSLFLRSLFKRPTLIFQVLRMAKDFAIALSSLNRAWRWQLSQRLPALLTCNR